MIPELWLDSSVATSVPQVRSLAQLAREKGVRVVVSAQVHLEICRQRRVKDSERFSAELVQSFLRQLAIEVAEVRFDQSTAETWSKLLHRRFPSSEAWKQAKLASVRGRLPVGSSLPVGRVPMTTDWLIALAVEERGARAVVADKGEEWRALREAQRAMSYDEAMHWLAASPHE